MPRQPRSSFTRTSALTGILASAIGLSACLPAPTPRTQRETSRRQRGIDVSGPFLEFRGRANQLGDLARVASTFRVIAVDTEPAHEKFSAADLETLRADGRNTVLGIVNVGFCDRGSTYWRNASEGVLPCVANLVAQIGERAGRPQQMWMDLDNFEYQRLILEYVAPRIEKTGVDGLLLDGFDLLDHDADDDAPCDSDCAAGGLSLLMALRQEFPDLILVTQGGLSRRVREARARRTRLASFLDGIVGEEVYTPSYDADKEANLLAWQKLGMTVNGHPFAILTQDYVKGCGDETWAGTIWQASRSHGFSAAISTPAVSRPAVCFWSFLR